MASECGKKYDPEVVAPIKGIPCNMECGSGEYFSVNTSARDYKCQKCPRNTYSNGGGFSINGDLGEWTEALKMNS